MPDGTQGYDWSRITHLLRLGVVASLMVLVGDMLLGWGVSDPSVTGIPLMLTRYLTVPDWRIFASALLGLVGIPVECLCWFAMYRMIRPNSEGDAHLFRAGIIGCLAFGGCGVHVLCCTTVYLLKHLHMTNPSTVAPLLVPWVVWFLLPATLVFLVFFLLSAITQIRAFAKGHTPLPRWCWVFSVLFGIAWLCAMRLVGDHAWANALATGWISVGNLWMTGGLLWQTTRMLKADGTTDGQATKQADGQAG